MKQKQIVWFRFSWSPSWRISPSLLHFWRATWLEQGNCDLRFFRLFALTFWQMRQHRPTGV